MPTEPIRLVDDPEARVLHLREDRVREILREELTEALAPILARLEDEE